MADLLAHSVKARFPAQDKASLLGYRAGKQEKAAARGGLFGG